MKKNMKTKTKKAKKKKHSSSSMKLDILEFTLILKSSKGDTIMHMRGLTDS